MKKHYRIENDCLNCGTILAGKFCHNCGQENLEMKESFGHMLNHAVSDYFHFDYQFFHTLRPLFLKPGHLTTEYLAGRRAQYLHPVKMYIFISLVFFVFFLSGSNHNAKSGKQEHAKETTSTDTVKKNIGKAINADKNLTKEQKKVLAEKVDAWIPDKIAKEIEHDRNKDKAQLKVDNDDGGGFVVYGDDKLNKFKNYDAYLADQQKLPEAKRDNFIWRYITKKGFDWKNQGKNAKEVLFEGLKHNAPKVMFLLLPLFALILKVAFWKNHKLYVEHIIYAIHLHCFLFLFLTITILVKIIIPDNWETLISIIQAAATLSIIWYIYRSLRLVYNRTRWRTVSKMVGVSFMYSMVFGLSVFIILVITALTSV
ncbi:DUF3667 domain-containing protein [Mucilaginibacter phyllosphaerae]|uniref:DUF3667 domain-containing protein n=1 Tax=Mucilaginibacter phyllosphaerae TaxID=1812349 RepID=A0A4Y8A7A7_9SPHI|nr:DUF3667 domain-containing protein [Mucilaginibacter phyllosphaerae]MBB3970800.1 hypothetical protein [Mucilaginibacter phyllosphaerae]TEW64260.1 DUF3667 domain-containing protein [Mucilaginibacter phyllosphaerae]GGH04682.1 hypothetical protein GCM10007352_08030 [Mucilaginibacter phyllosphaerae]